VTPLHIWRACRDVASALCVLVRVRPFVRTPSQFTFHACHNKFLDELALYLAFAF